MIKVRRRPFILWFLAYALLVSCSANPALPKSLAMPVTLSPTPEIQLTPAPSPTSADAFRVVAWVNEPTPARESKVILLGSLIKNGVYLGGIMMGATWPDKEQPRGSPNCYVMVLYQRGVCTIDVSQYPPGEYVPIQISFEYQGLKFYGQTGFTPR